jgi:hypothetical protein
MVFSSFLCVLCVKEIDFAAESFNTEDTEKRGENRRGNSIEQKLCFGVAGKSFPLALRFYDQLNHFAHGAVAA